MTGPSSNARAGFLIVRPPDLVEIQMSSAVTKCALRVAGNLACRRPFRPPFPIRDDFLGLLHRPLTVDEVEESRAEALRRLKPAPRHQPVELREWPKPRGGLKARLQPGSAATQQRCRSTQFPQPPNSPGTRSGDPIVLLAAVLTYGLIRAFSDVYPGITGVLAAPKGAVA
jgi:hypothetical protein